MLTTDRVAGAGLVLLALVVFWESRHQGGRAPGARRTPEPVLAKLRDTLRAAVGDADFKGALAKIETPIVFKQGAEFSKFFEADAARLAEGVRKVGRIGTK